MVVRRRHLDVELELTGGAPTDDPSSAAIAPLAAAVTDRAAAEEAAGATVHLAADHPAESDDAVADAVADAAGFPRRRDLLQLRRPLPQQRKQLTPARSTSTPRWTATRAPAP